MPEPFVCTICDPAGTTCSRCRKVYEDGQRERSEHQAASRQAWESNNGPVYEPIRREHDA